MEEEKTLKERHKENIRKLERETGVETERGTHSKTRKTLLFRGRRFCLLSCWRVWAEKKHLPHKKKQRKHNNRKIRVRWCEVALRTTSPQPKPSKNKRKTKHPKRQRKKTKKAKGFLWLSLDICRVLGGVLSKARFFTNRPSEFATPKTTPKHYETVVSANPKK